ncbi:MAG: hypothetical protein ABR548_06895 [Actinomycetota bacterium]|nr:hypothetical protein [Actinomycetota bacterium]
MSPRMDLSAISPAERAVFGFGSLLFVNGFVPWWYRIQTVSHTYRHNAGLGGWSLLAVLAGFVAAVAVMMRRRPARGPWPDWLFYIALGVIAFIALAIQSRETQSEWIGYWLALTTSVLMVLAGVRRNAERRGGWV